MRWLRDPIVLFVLLGSALSALHLVTREPPSPIVRDTQIVVTDADVAWLAQAYERTWNRPPTASEIRALVDRRIRDEMLYREAVALGLEAGDESIRRRLGMKLEFLAKDAGAAAEPTDDELRAAIEAAPERYAIPPRIGFTQVYVSEDRRGEAAADEARALLSRLQREPDTDLDTVGDPLLLERVQAPQTPREIERRFGQSFADALFAIDADDGWHGPLRSGYGLHLVRIDERVPGGPAPLEHVRNRVRTDVVEVRREAALQAYLDALRDKYDVQVRATLPEAQE